MRGSFAWNWGDRGGAASWDLETYKLVQPLCSTETSRTGSNNQDVNVPRKQVSQKPNLQPQFAVAGGVLCQLEGSRKYSQIGHIVNKQQLTFQGGIFQRLLKSNSAELPSIDDNSISNEQSC